ncbi:MAG: HDIG domain-containing protein [Chlorobi bacterium]|nr:HDIG domain-containing protein [Chlorobiota bacterium]
MKEVIKFVREHSKGILRIIYLLATIAIITYIYPREGKFRYEFQKGKPWLHEDLYAPYDFPVYKTDVELQKERDSLLQDFKPYFRLDTNIRNVQIAKMDEDFTSRWKQYLKQKYKIKTEPAGKTWRERRLIAEKKRLEGDIYKWFQQIYDQGVVQVQDVFTMDENPSAEVVILRGNLAEETDTSHIFTLRSAYLFLQNHIQGYDLSTYADPSGIHDLLSSLDLNSYVRANLEYDPETSERVREDMVSGLSLTRGMVQQGERIISKGEIVDSQTFQILESLKIEYEKRVGSAANSALLILGQVILIGVLMIMLFLFLMYFRKPLFVHTKDLLFLFFMIILFVGISRLIIMAPSISYYVIPLAIVPIIIRTFYDARLALFVHLVIVLLVGFLAPNSYEFVIMNMIAGLMAIYSLTNIYRRNKFIMASVMAFTGYVVVFFANTLVQEGTLQNMNWTSYVWFAGNGFLVLLSFPLIYIFEKTFGFLSDATLVELADTNQPLLRKLAEKAPGTFQHVLQVANLAEEAARVIGGHQLLIRTGALYHDLGKMEEPIYFIENQTEGFNPHDQLSFKESAVIIIRHVEKGMEIAEKHNLPRQIIDFIRTHHGTTKVQFFYRSYMNKFPDETVDENDFTYPGPKPFTKETAILMMADSVEAASRSLKEYSDTRLDQLVEDIIEEQLKDGQFVNAPITFKDIYITKEIFKKRLKTIYHARIAYPVKR